MAKDLLTELNGGAKIERVDSAPAPAPSRESELTVGGAPEPSAAVKMDAQFSTKAGGKGYRIYVKGEYIAEAADGKSLKPKKPYTVEVLLPDLEAALSKIRNYLIKPALKKKYPDFVAARTIYIDKAEPLSPETPRTRNLQYMDLDALKDYVAHVNAPIDVDTYRDVTHLRDAIIDWTQTPRGFGEREKARQDKRRADKELADLNPDLDLDE